MHVLLKRRSWRVATTWLLAAMQLHLLLVLVFHHHYVPEFALAFSTTTNTVQQADRHRQPLNRSQDCCAGCQIVRHGAVRPALGNPTAQRLSVSPLLTIRVPAVVLIVQPATWHGRAPPLA